VSRGLPQVDSVWEVKTVLPRSEVDDSRPVLYPGLRLPGLTCMLGAKIDNIYDVLEVMAGATNPSVSRPARPWAREADPWRRRTASPRSSPRSIRRRHRRAFVRDVLAVLKQTYENYELVLVDDGSTDATAAAVTALLAEERCIRLIRLSRRFGRDIAISAGLDTVIGDFSRSCSRERSAELIPRSREVPTRRRHRLRHPGPPARRAALPLAGHPGFYWYFNRIVGVELPRNSTDYRAYSRQSVNAITRIHDRLRYLRTFGAYVGFGGEPLVYEPRPGAPAPRRRTPRRPSGSRST